jgi:hypothetical protein
MTTPSEPGGEEQRFEPMPSAPALSESEQAPGVPAPRAVNVSFILWMVAAAVTIVSLVLALTAGADAISTAVRDSLRTSGKAFTEEDVRKGANAVKAFIGIVSGLFVVAFIVFGVAFRSGKNWGRIGITIAGVLNLLLVVYGLLSGGSAGLINLVVLLILVVAIYLLYRPESKQFFASGRAVR